MIVICENCGKEFDKKNCKVKISKHHYCSRKCMIEFKKQKPKICFYCGKSFTGKYNKKFCSISCSVSFSNQRRNRFKEEQQTDIYCAYCGVKIINRHSRFCSLLCSSEYKKNESYKRIEEDQIVSHGTLRKYLLNKQNEKCSRCGWGERNPLSNSVCLDLHHKDGNAKNNRLSNVELICPNCHSLTETYKRVGDRNRKSFRIGRNK